MSRLLLVKQGMSRASACRSARRQFSASAARGADFTHAVIGGGVVGLAIARRLQQRSDTSTVLIERHDAVGTETSSRNSEVIHAGLYYGNSSLKTKLCVSGKSILYELCEKHRIPYRRCGKWIVAQDNHERKVLEDIHAFAKSIDVPTRFLTADQARSMEPDVQAKTGALESSSTGIIDSHALMQYLQTSFADEGGVAALRSTVTDIQPPSSIAGEQCWKIGILPTDSIAEQEISVITTETIINSAGLYACEINNLIMPPERQRKPFYAKGTYFSYAAKSPRPQRLIYPAPVAGHAGLGTHLTLDMRGGVRFGPDVEWVSDPTDLAPSNDEERREAAILEINRFLPSVTHHALTVDYCGIRPKLGRLGAADGVKGFQDFYIELEKGFPGLVNLLAIESPGLTSSLAIGEYVHDLLYA